MKLYQLMNDSIIDTVTADRNKLLERIIQLTKKEEKYIRIDMWEV